jgi:NAD(P)-dependent dehydrogenase (short-subunit alcohol dehydrogenase family)
MALAGVTECLATELPANVHINCLALGSVNTQMLKDAFPDYEAKVEPNTMARYIVNFAINAPGVQNGKIIEVSLTNP